MNRTYRMALACGALPLVVGVSIFLLWLITRRDWLMFAGIITIYAGTILVLAGAVVLARFFWVALRTDHVPPRRVWLRTVGGACLLLINFPVAGGIVIAANSIMSCYNVTVHNATADTLSNVRIIGAAGACEANFDAIPPRSAAQRTLRVHAEGPLNLRVTASGRDHESTIDDYAVPGLGGNVSVTVNADGTIDINPP